MRRDYTRTVAVLFCFLVLTCHATEQDEMNEELIGWQGASFDPQSVFGQAYASGPVKVSEQPLAFVWKEFISRDEAKHIAHLAAPRLRRSLVGDGQQSDEIRSSYGMFIPRFYDATIAGIEDRLAKWTGLPYVNQEEMQVLRYSPGQNYKQHMDSNGRMATVLIYLTDTEEGGETAFPSTTDEHWTDISLKPEGLSPDCAEGHVAVKPEVGTALLFYSMPPGSEDDESLRIVDKFSLHTGCPPAEGQIKWTATIWSHFDAFRPEGFSEDLPKPDMPDPAVCEDLEPRCKMWAEAGECEKNEPYMVGAGSAFGHCGVSCGSCSPCPAGDAACLIANRERLGYIGDLKAELERLFPSA
eukprot:jgi/Ulvmu1/4250/UM192_0010.1